MAPRLRSAVVRFDALPEPVLRVLMLSLPVDARARAACVCRAWRAFLADVSLWHVLDLTPAGGVVAERVTENLVRGAVARAAGRLSVISLNNAPNREVRELLVAVIVSDGAELQQVNTDALLSVKQLDAVFAAAPRLQALNARVSDSCVAVIPVLRNDPPYGPMRVSRLDVSFGDGESHAVLLACAAAVAAHETLKSLNLEHVHSPHVLNVLVDAAAERRVSEFSVGRFCFSDAETVPAVTRLLQRGLLTKLDVSCGGFPHAQEASELWAAVRACQTLTHLELALNPPDGADRRFFTELLDAVASLSALCVLDLSYSNAKDAAAFGDALGELLAANLSSLRTLNVNGCYLGDEGLAPLLEGLEANTHLRKLNCLGDNDISYEFERDWLEPALAALAARAQLDE